MLLIRLYKCITHLKATKPLRFGLLAFALAFLPHLLTNPCAPFHHEVATHLDWAIKPGNRLIGAIPREHAKTTLGTVALTLREICRGEKQNIMLVAANSAEAEVKLRQIVNELETNPALIAGFGGRIKPARDTKGHNVAYADNEIILAGGCRVCTIGFGGKVRGQLSGGRRLDLIILDDPEDDTTVANPAMRKKLRDWADRALLNALDVEQGSLVWLGTLLHHDSVLAQWMVAQVNRPNWRIVKYSALNDAGTPLWPGRWSREKLALRQAEIGDRAFAQEYLNQPVSLAGQLFKPGCFPVYNHRTLQLNNDGCFLGDLPLTVVAGIDPAIGQNAEHDYFAALVLGIDQQARTFVLDVIRRRLPFSEQIRLVEELGAHWRPRLIAVESVAYQAALAQSLWERGLPVIQTKPKAPKAQRIEAVAARVATGTIKVPAVGSWVADFRQEAEEYPAGKHDDQLDALAMALEVGLPLVNGAGKIFTAGKGRKDSTLGFFGDKEGSCPSSY